ncbi:MAG: FtsX-like permease family protein [Acidobacteriota bacterium]
MIHGRDFGPEDGAAGRPEVTLVSRSFALEHGPGGPSGILGARLRFDPQRNPQAPWRTVVGVVPDLALGGLDTSSRAGIYVPRAEWLQASYQRLVVRVEPGAMSADLPADRWVESLVHREDPEVAVYWAKTLEKRLEEGLSGRSRTRSLLIILGVSALALAGSGLYAVLALAVAQRRRELAVRSALGALGRDLGRMVAASCLRQTGLGLLLGILVAERLASALEKLYGVDPLQPRAILAVLAILAAMAGAAAWLPGRRAARTDPSDVLRDS